MACQRWVLRPHAARGLANAINAQGDAPSKARTALYLTNGHNTIMPLAGSALAADKAGCGSLALPDGNTPVPGEGAIGVALGDRIFRSHRSVSSRRPRWVGSRLNTPAACRPYAATVRPG